MSKGTHKAIHSILKAAAKAEEESQSSLKLMMPAGSSFDIENSTLPPNMLNYRFTGPLRPVYPLSPKRLVPATIRLPDYAHHRVFPIHFIAE